MFLQKLKQYMSYTPAHAILTKQKSREPQQKKKHTHTHKQTQARNPNDLGCTKAASCYAFGAVCGGLHCVRCVPRWRKSYSYRFHSDGTFLVVQLCDGVQRETLLAQLSLGRGPRGPNHLLVRRTEVEEAL